MKPIERVKEIIRYYNLSISGFEKKIQMSNNSIQTAIKRVAHLKDNTLNKIINTFPDISPEWLLTGNGKMFRKEITHYKGPHEIVINEIPALYPSQNKSIPLLSESAFTQIEDKAQIPLHLITDKYSIPALKDVDFLLTLKGNAMVPKYNSGDLIACKRIPLDSYWQWNHIYVISTAQNILIRRIREGKDENHLEIISENPEFQPFQLHKKEINNIAIVAGAILLA